MIIDLRRIKALAIAVISYLLLFWLFPVHSFIGLYAVIGIMVAVISKDKHEALIIGSLAGLTGSLIAVWQLTVEKYIYYVETMPVTANPDIPVSIYTGQIFELVKIGPLSFINAPLYVVISIFGCALFSQVHRLTKLKEHLLKYVLVVILAVNFLFISVFSTQSFARYVSSEPPDLSYAYDAIVYLKTSYLLGKEGYGNYYKAHLEAQYKDIRRNTDGTVTKDGFISTVSSLHVREPFIFYFWKYLSFGNFANILYLSFIICIALLFLSAWASGDVLQRYSSFLPVVIIPFLFTGTIWFNVFFPDWWAGLFIFTAFLFWLRSKFWIAAVFLLMALLCREVIAAAYFVFLASAFLKERKALIPLLTVGAVFAILYGMHYIGAKQIFINSSPGLPVDSIKIGFASFRLIPNISYLMFFYGYFKVPVIIVTLLSVFSSLVYKKFEFLAFALYLVVHNSLGASSYWGNHFMLILLFIACTFTRYELNMQTISQHDKP